MRHDQLDELLDRSVLALRATPVPEGPPPDLYASLLRAPQTRSGEDSPARLRQRRRPMPLFWKVAFAAAVIALVASQIVWFGNGRGSSGIAFADVLQKVSEAKTLTYKITTKSPGQPDTSRTARSRSRNAATSAARPSGTRLSVVHPFRGVYQNPSPSLDNQIYLDRFIRVSSRDRIMLGRKRK